MHRLDGIYQDEHFQSPLKDYHDEGDRWYTGSNTLYVQYVSTTFLTTPASWPTYFLARVAAELAVQIGPSLKNEGADIENARFEFERITREAESADAMRGPPQRIASGSWTRSRHEGNRRRQRP